MTRIKAWIQFLSWPFKATLTGEVSNKHVVLDYLHVENAVLKDCTIHYGGGDVYSVNTTFDHCRWEFFGRAGSALALMKKMYEMPGGKDIIRNTFPDL
jgi:hypothetical protein